jgi:hypothetical protein
MFSWKFILCAALLATVATAETGDYVAGSGGGDAPPPTAGEMGMGGGDMYADYEVYDLADAPGSGDYSEAVASSGDYAQPPAPEEAPPAAKTPAASKPVKPTGALAPAPATGKLTIGSLIGSVCPDIAGVLSGANFSSLAGLIADPEIAKTEITLPEGVVVIAAPTNTALLNFLSAVGPTVASNKTLLATVLANHIAVATDTAATSAKALSRDTLSFWTEMGGSGSPAPLPATIADLVASNGKNGVITDAASDALVKISGAVKCPTQNQYAFVVDTVIVPAKFERAEEAAAPKPAPSSAFVASAFAAVGAIAALMMM